jgi:short-subunit dehydrogenase
MESIFTENRTALITGASAGIGFELAKVLAPKLDLLIVMARRCGTFGATGGKASVSRAIVEAADLSDAGAVESLLKRLDKHSLTVDVLINNAGLGEAELFERSSLLLQSHCCNASVVSSFSATDDQSH